MRHLKGLTLVDGLALEYLEGLVGQFGTDGAAHVAVLFALVLVEHTDDTAVLVLGECHEMFHDECRLHRVVDVGHKILDTVEDDDIGLEHADGHIDHLLAPVETKTAEVEGIEPCVVERFEVCQRHDTVFQDLLRALLTLFGVYPKHLQRLFAQSFEGEHLFFQGTRHEDGQEERLAALRLTAVGHEFATIETVFLIHPKQRLHRWQFGFGCDAF